MNHDDTAGLERLFGRVLAGGTHTSTLLLAAGLTLILFEPRRGPGLLLHAGLVLLMATPVLRVGVAVVAFVRRREWWFVLFTVLVLALIASGFIAALAS